MFINKNEDRNNICGTKIEYLRKQKQISQNQLATELQILGLSVDKNAIQRIESGKRFITDIELPYFASFFGISILDLYDIDDGNNKEK